MSNLIVVGTPGVVVPPEGGGGTPPIDTSIVTTPKPNQGRHNLRPRLAAIWRSWNGVDEWTLTERTSPVFVLRGATGTRGAPVEQAYAETQRDGAPWEGVRVAKGQLGLQIRLDAPDWEAMRDLTHRFEESLEPDKVSTLRMVTPDGKWRDLSCRYVDGLDYPIELDPLASRTATYSLTWDTPDPFWLGEEVVTEFPFGDAVRPNFPAPPMQINSSQTFGSATVTNPGRGIGSPAVWRIDGPFAGFSVGVGGALISAPNLTKAKGQWVDIDATPGVKTVTDESGADLWLSLTSRAGMGAEIPPGVDVPVDITATGVGPGFNVRLAFRPRYRSGW